MHAAEEADDVAAYLVPRIREVPPKASTLTGGIASQYIQYLTKPKAFSQIFSVRGGCVALGCMVAKARVRADQPHPAGRASRRQLTAFPASCLPGVFPCCLPQRLITGARKNRFVQED
jgi:hypothetical protein